MSVEHSHRLEDDDREIEKTLTEVERSLSALNERYAQVKRDRYKRTELLERQQQLEQLQKNNPNKEPIKTELRHIQQELEQLEENLESRLFSFNFSPFWQAIRFGGLGILIGWLLKSCAG
jgi:DNA repair exonuclease SbcCD ATPase subunit